MSAEQGWGSTRELNPMETLMWRADIDPRTRATVMAVEILDLEPDWDRLVAAHEWASRMIPRFRDRVVEPLGMLGTPVWSRDADLDLHYHLRRVRLGGGGNTELFALAEQLAMTPFDRARPPWEAVLVQGLADSKAAYLLKLHHALTDGMGLAQLLSQIHSRSRESNPAKPQPELAVAPDAGNQLARQLRKDLGGVPSTVRSGGGALVKGLRAPAKFVRGAREYAESTQRVLAPPEVKGLPLLAARSTSWRFVALDVEFTDLRAAAKAVGGTINDAFLASLLAGFRIYHEEMGTPLQIGAAMPVSVPVSVRSADDSEGGNYIAPARMAAPVGLLDPARRIAAVGNLMRNARAEPALRSAEVVAPLIARLPASMVIKLAGAATASNDLQASNVPGIREDVYLTGAKIERIYGFAPLPGCAAMIAMNSHGSTCCVGANIDAAAITDPALFGRSLAKGFAEVLALSPGATEPRLLT